MEKSQIDSQRMFPTNNQTPKGCQPSKSAFSFVAPPIAAQLTPILSLRPLAVLAMRHNQFNAALLQLLPQKVTVIASVRDQAFRFLARSPRSRAGHGNRRQGSIHKLYFRRRGRVQVDSQRKTLAVDHHHPLRALAPLGFADSRAPFLAGAKLPSIKASRQLSCLRSSSVPKKARQMSSQTSCSSQSFNRRQQVEGLGYSLGKSFQRAPVRSIHRISSRTLRLLAQGRPPRLDIDSFGNSGSIIAHCLLVKNGLRRLVIGGFLPMTLSHKPCLSATPISGL